MSEHVLPFDSRDREPRAIWPWVVVVASGAALVLAVGERLAAIPDSLESQARSLALAAGADTIGIALDGRDVTLTGELDADVRREALVRDIAAVDGVRVVRDELVVIDPAARRLEAREAFRDALLAIDVTRVAFEAGSAAFARGSDAALTALVQLMRERPGHRIRIAGHTDSRGRESVNLELSRERAAAVADALVGRGIDPSRVVAQGYGATQPVADNATDAGRARNRRIEISYID